MRPAALQRHSRIARGTLFALPVLVLLYATLLEPNWIDVTHHRVGDPSREQIRLAVLADLHLADVGHRELLALEAVNRAQPDIVILAGDVIDDVNRLPALGDFLSRLMAPHVIAVLGNWEHWGEIPLEALKQRYRQHNASLLVNESSELKIKGRSIRLVGLDDSTAGQPQLDKVMGGGDKPTRDISILVQHSPGFFDALLKRTPQPADRFDLCLSGHTHGGQVTLFGWPIGPLPPGSGAFAAGWYDVRHCPLYVSRGIGTSVLAVRLFARPEVAVFDY